MTASRQKKPVRPLRNGQITIPAEFRRKLGITPDSMLELSIDGEELRIKRVEVHRVVGDMTWFRSCISFSRPCVTRCSSAT